MFIDAGYFKGELIIPNLSSLSGGDWTSNAVANSVSKSLQLLIDKYEKKFLIELLGKDIYERFIEGVANEIPEWMELKSRIINDERKESPIANYVYYWFRRDDISKYAAVGETVGLPENSVIISPARKMTRAWNEMSMEAREVSRWLKERPFYGYKPHRSDIFENINEFNL